MNNLTKDDLAYLKDALSQDRVLLDHSLAEYTTFKIGGPADAFFEARSSDDLARSIQVCRSRGISYFVLGLGANILVGDRGVRGLVIRNVSAASSISETGVLETESGAIVWPDVIEQTIAAGWSGLEHYAGIPSTIGGAMWQNLHFLSPAPERERTMFIDEVVLDARILSPDGKTRTVNRDYFEFGYDTSILHTSGDIVLSVRFQLEQSTSESIWQVVEDNLLWRSTRHPPLDTEPSAGSIFQKIEGIGAGRLIDQCGMKGTRIGGVEITHRHANIMINHGDATAQNVRDMIDLVVKTVMAKTGYVLQPEIAFVGEF